MSQSSSRPSPAAIVLSLSVAMGSLSLLPSPAAAQALGGMRRAGPVNSNAPQAPQQAAPQQQQAPPQAQPQQAQPQQAAPAYRPAPTPFRRVQPFSPAQTFSPAPEASRPVAPIFRGYSNNSAPAPQAAPQKRRGIFGMRDDVVQTYRDLRPAAPQGLAGSRNDNGPTIGYSNRPTYPVITPTGPQYFPSRGNDNYLYQAPSGVTIVHNAPNLLGGYYYSNYCDGYYNTYTYPSIYSVYLGFPRYIYNPSVIVIGSPYYPVYETGYQPFYPPAYQVTYNQTNYYVANEDRAAAIEGGGERARQAVRDAYPADSYQAAFADIERAWNEGSVSFLRKHIRDNDTKLSVFLDKKYSYSIASGDFLQITRDALDRLQTSSFRFTRLRKARNGDVTAFGKHVYRVSDSSNSSDGQTVPFDRSGDNSDSPYDRSNDPATGEAKTVYVSYTLRHKDDQWYIIAVDSSTDDLVAQRPADTNETAAPHETALTQPVETVPDPALQVAAAPPALPVASAPAIRKVTLSVTRQGSYALNGKRVARAHVLPLLRAKVRHNPHLTVALQYDRALSTAQFQQAMSLIKQAGPESVLVTNLPAPKMLAHKKMASRRH